MDLLITVIITVVVETKKCMQVLEEVTSTKVSTKATKKKTACISAGAFSSLLVMLHLDQTTKKIFMGPWQKKKKRDF